MEIKVLFVLLLVGLALASWEAPAREATKQIKRELKAAGGAQICQMFPVLSPIPPNYAPLAELISQFSQNVSNIVEGTGTPSMTVNLVYDQDILWSQGFGLKNLSDPNSGAPDGDTMYRIGSNSKLFTVLLGLMAQDQGLLEFTEEVASYVPEFAPINPFPSKKTITFAELASHMSGLQRESPCMAFTSDCNIDNEEMWERLQNVTLVNPPGAIPEYSNCGIAVLGHALEEIMQSNWSSLVEAMILTPLGMNNTGAEIDEHFLSGYAVGYDELNAVAPLINIGWESPAGNMYSSANDLSKFMSFIFRDDVPYMQQPDQILDALSIREWMQPRYINIDNSGFGLPWEILVSPIIYSKGGAIMGYLSFFVFVPQMKFGMIILQSSFATSGMANTTLEFLANMVRPFAEILQAVAPPPYIPEEFNNYVGMYLWANESVEVTILKTTPYPMMALMQGPEAIALEYISGNMYRMSTQGIPMSCDNMESGITEYVYFYNTNPPTFQIPGLLPGITATRIQQ